MGKDSTIYLMNHFSAGVILSGNRDDVCRQSLRKVFVLLYTENMKPCLKRFKNVTITMLQYQTFQVDYGKYQALISFINVHGNHWKFLVKAFKI